mgnify:CR=1 FL=1
MARRHRPSPFRPSSVARARCAGGAGVLALLLAAPFALPAQQGGAPVNERPNPFTTIEGWAKMPEGRTWGSTSAVEVDKDELHADYVAHARMLGVRPKTKAGLGMVIKKKAGFGDRQVVTHDCRKTWRWVLPKLADARAIWARRVGRG